MVDQKRCGTLQGGPAGGSKSSAVESEETFVGQRAGDRRALASSTFALADGEGAIDVTLRRQHGLSSLRLGLGGAGRFRGIGGPLQAGIANGAPGSGMGRAGDLNPAGALHVVNGAGDRSADDAS